MTTTTSPHAGQPGALPAAPATRRTIDAPTRMFHWLLAFSFLGAYVTAEAERWRALHVSLGYAMAGLLAFRLIYAFFGPPTLRLSALGARAMAPVRWLRGLRGLRGDVTAWAAQARQVSPLVLGLSMVLLLGLIVPLAASGIVVFHDGPEWMEEVHEFLGNAMLLTVAAHLAALLVESLRRRRNLAQPMLTGRIEGRGPDLAKHNRAWLAVALLAAVLTWFAWEWQAAPNGLLPTDAGRARIERHHHDHDD